MICFLLVPYLSIVKWNNYYDREGITFYYLPYLKLKSPWIDNVIGGESAFGLVEKRLIKKNKRKRKNSKNLEPYINICNSERQNHGSARTECL